MPSAMLSEIDASKLKSDIARVNIAAIKAALPKAGNVRWTAADTSWASQKKMSFEELLENNKGNKG